MVLSLALAFLTHTWAADSDSSDGSTGVSLLTRNPFHLSLSVDGGYDTNVATTDEQNHGSAFTQAQAIASGTFGTDRTNTSVGATVQTIYFNEGDGPNPEVNSTATVAGSYSLSRRLLITGHLAGAYQIEPNFGANIGPDRRVGYFFTSTDDISASFHWFDRLSTVTTDNFMIVRYDNSAIAFDQDRIEETIGQQFQWSISRAALVGEYRLQIVDYDHADRNSISHYVLGGIDYSVSQRLRLTTRGGATFRFFDDGSLRTEPRVEGSLDYALGRTSSVSCNVSYGLEEPDDPVFTSRTTFRAGVQLKYWLSAHILSRFTGYYTDSRNTSSNAAIAGEPNEQSYSISMGLEYALTSRWSIHTGFDYSGIASDLGSRDYSRERYTGGVVVNF